MLLSGLFQISSKNKQTYLRVVRGILLGFQSKRSKLYMYRDYEILNNTLIGSISSLIPGTALSAYHPPTPLPVHRGTAENSIKKPPDEGKEKKS